MFPFQQVYIPANEKKNNKINTEINQKIHSEEARLYLI
jgi:hypothetical protein